MDKRKTIPILLCLLFLFLCSSVPLFAQNAETDKVTIEFKNERLPDIFKRLEKMTGCVVLFTYNDVQQYTATGSVKNKTVKEAMNAIIGNKPLTVTYNGKYINIKPKNAAQRRGNRDIVGMVVDENGEPLPGATVANVKKPGSRETFAVVTDVNGHFKLTVSGDVDQLEVSYVGFDTQVVNLTARNDYRVQLKTDSHSLDEVVVIDNGMYTRRAESFTGATTSFNKDELRAVGNINVLQSLKNLDPSFHFAENLAVGSNPNALPDITLRGQSGFPDLKGEYQTNPNQPLFIVDGFETSLTIKGCQWRGDYRDGEAQGRRTARHLYGQREFQHARPLQLRPYQRCRETGSGAHGRTLRLCWL